MRALRSLIWKELSEQAWKLAFGCVLLAGFVAVALETRVAQDESTVRLTVFFGALILPILTATGVVAREREDGDLRCLLSLPVRPSVVFAVKTGVGLAASVLPLLVAALSVFVLAGDREVPGAVLVVLYASGGVTAMALFVWTVSLGMFSSTQAAVGLVGFLVVIISFVLTSLVMTDWHIAAPWTPLAPYIEGSMAHHTHVDAGRWIAAAFAQVPLCGLAWVFALWRFAAASSKES